MNSSFSFPSFGKVFLFLVLCSSLVFAVSFIDAIANNTVRAGGNISVSGQIINGSNLGQGINGLNLSYRVSGGNQNDSTTTSNGSFVFNISAPSTLGYKNVTIFDNSSDTGVHSRTSIIFVTNCSNVSFSYTSSRPPFTNGTSFGLNVTVTHFNGSKIAGYNPVVIIYSSAGKVQNWTVTNSSAATDITGTKSYTITIPSDAAGQYVFLVENGVGSTFFEVKSVIRQAATTESSSGETKQDYALGSQVRLLAKVRDSNSSPVTGATVTAAVTFPNGTIFNYTLNSFDTIEYPGYYDKNVTLPAAVNGSFTVKIVTARGSAREEGSVKFNVKVYASKLGDISASENSGFFREWGGFKGIVPGGQVGFKVLVTNLSSSSLITGGVNYNANNQTTNCTALENVVLFFPNGTLFAQSTTTAYGNITEAGTAVCQMSFATPSTAGTYIARINVSINGTNTTAEGIFTTQNYFVKARAVSGFGDSAYQQYFSPGDNVTFSISIFNLSSNLVISNGSNVTALAVKRISAVDFKSGGSDRNISAWTTCAHASCLTRSFTPQAIVNMPNGTTGLLIVEFLANVSADNLTGTNVSGSAFVLSKYIEGFLVPQGIGGGFGGSGAGFGFEPNTKCSGTETFVGFARDLKTNQNAQGVVVNGVLELRNEVTGKDSAGCISVNQSISDSSTTGNNVNVNVSFTSNDTCSFSGRHFAIFNVSYQGNEDKLPAGFKCSQISFFPSVRINRTTATGQNSNDFQMGSTDSFNVSVSSVRRGSDNLIVAGSASWAYVASVESFSPTTGRSFARASIPVNITLNAAGEANLTVNTSVFGLSRWPSGFVMFNVVVVNGSLTGSSEAGLQVVSFNAFAPFTFGGSQQIAPGDLYNVTLFVQSNVSKNATWGGQASPQILGTNGTGFSIKVGRPWEGQVSTATINNVLLSADNWNRSGDFNYEVWLINFTVPTDAPKGFSPAIITINNSVGDTAEVFVPIELTKYRVAIPDQESVQTFSDGVSTQTGNFNASASVTLGATVPNLNLTHLFYAHGISSRSGFVCGKSQLNTIKYGFGGQTNTSYNNTIRIAIIDNGTAGVYDTVVMNQSGGTNAGGIVTITNTSNRSLLLKAFTLSLWKVLACPDVTFVNGSNSLATGFSNNWGGQHVSGSAVTIPFKVTRGGNGVASATVGIKNIVEQNDFGGSRGGMGFKSILVEGTNYVVNSQATTDASGIGFVNVTVSSSGQFNIFWNMTSGSDTDTASFENGIFIEAKKFRVDGQQITSVPRTVVMNFTPAGVAVCSNSWCVNASSYYNNSGSGALTLTNFNWSTNQTLFIGAWNEATQGSLINDSINDSWFIAFDPINFQIRMGNASNLSAAGNAINAQNANNSFNIGSSQFQAGHYNLTVANTTLILQLYHPPSSGVLNYRISSSTANLTTRVCSTTFGAQQTPVIGANVSFFIQKFGPSGATITNLTFFSAQNGTEVSEARTTEFGCFVATIKAPSTGWPSSRGTPTELKVRAYNGSNLEQGWAGMLDFFN